MLEVIKSAKIQSYKSIQTGGLNFGCVGSVLEAAPFEKIETSPTHLLPEKITV